jgi:EF hand
MNSKKKLTIAGSLTLALGLALGSVALADDGHGRRGGRMMMEKFDTNGDGVLDEAERGAAKLAMHAKREARRAQIDLNHDGQIDDNERAAAKKARAFERFKRIDANGDGAITLAEFEAAAPRHGGGFRHRGMK